jgi:hypothetical protein
MYIIKGWQSVIKVNSLVRKKKISGRKLEKKSNNSGFFLTGRFGDGIIKAWSESSVPFVIVEFQN